MVDKPGSSSEDSGDDNDNLLPHNYLNGDDGEEEEETQNNTPEERENVMVVVLGDIGHSPRMNYHALSLAEEGYEVNLIGFSGTKPPLEVLENDHITLTYMTPCPKWVYIFPRIISFFLKVFLQSLILFFTLISCTAPSKLLLQNPPAVPAMPVCWLYCLIVRSKFLIDWHNYGYSIMALSLSPSHLLVKIYKFVEKVFGKLAHGGLCVTKAMKEDLSKSFGINRIIVHYDRPHSRFHPISDAEKHNFFLRMGTEYPCFSSSSPDKTVFTERFADGRISFYEDRPALIVSSTSWTEDEDFSILLYALQDFERVRSQFKQHYPQLVVVITGKGPLKDYYVQDIQSRNWQHVAVVTPWLSAEDYPKLLASCDLGVCLHFSSSGLDLPMKVVDMFGSGIPVMAINYPALPELVQHNENGLVFSTKEELANLLQDWFRGFPKETAVKETYYDFYHNIAQFRRMKWHPSWTCNVLPLFAE
ncbi:UNVERIFIED_CONTAM: hypothetical protein RMT77_014140 [Armadillidium vulgare]